jgi:hypothetical protein
VNGLSDTAVKILRLFREHEGEAWDLHSFFEFTGGDEPERRAAVLDIVDALVAAGYLESRGSDFYTITPTGLEAARRGVIEGLGVRNR